MMRCSLVSWRTAEKDDAREREREREGELSCRQDTTSYTDRRATAPRQVYIRASAKSGGGCVEQAESTNHQGEAKSWESGAGKDCLVFACRRVASLWRGPVPKGWWWQREHHGIHVAWSSRWRAGWRKRVVLGMESETGYVDGLWGKC